MAYPAWFNEQQYLESKLAQLQAAGDDSFNTVSLKLAIVAAGYDAFTHFQTYSLVERTSPNTYFNAAEYLVAKAAQANATEAGGRTDWTADSIADAIAAAGIPTIWDHFATYGWAEGVNPSNDFDVSDYFANKLAQLQADEAGWTDAKMKDAFKAANLDPITHYLSYGAGEGVAVAVVPADEQVAVDGETPDAITQGLANIEAANLAVADFLAGLELDTNDDGTIDVEAGDATAEDVHVTDLDHAVSVYDALATADVANDSAALTAAKVTVYETTLNEALTVAQGALAVRDAEIAAVSGLTEALAAKAAADEALQAAKDEVVALYETGAVLTVAETVAIASLEANLEALADITAATIASEANLGEFGIVANSDDVPVSVTPEIVEVISIDSIKLGNSVVLAEYDASANRLVLTTAADELAVDADAADKALFAEYQALAATVISQANAAYAAHENLTALTTAAADAARELSYVDADAGVTAALADFDGKFTETTPADDTAPTLAEVAAEVAALGLAAVESQQLLVDAAAAVDTAMTSVEAAISGATLVRSDDEIVDSADGNAVVVNNLGEVQAAYVGAATTTLATLWVNELDAAVVDTTADLAVATFENLVNALNVALELNPLAVVNGEDADSAVNTDYVVLEAAVTAAENAIATWEDAVAALAEAQANDEALTGLEAAVTAAETAVTTETGFDVINNVDAASEFGSAENDLFIAGALDSTIYSASLQGEDALFVGTGLTYNAAVIGSDTGEVDLADAGDVSVLEFFMEEVGANVEVHLETKAYGSETGDYVTITLSGVALADVTVTGGLLTIV